jgi:hypothetical protein
LDIGCILDDLQSHGAMARYEVLVVERMDEGAVQSGKGMCFCCLPGLFI